MSHDGDKAEKGGDGIRRRREEKSSLRRELLAILVLYLVGAILPLLIGLAFGPDSV